VNGTLAPAVIKHLELGGFRMTLMTRVAAKLADKYHPNINIKTVDYTTVETLAPTLWVKM